MKKLLAISLVLVMVLSMFTSCGMDGKYVGEMEEGGMTVKMILEIKGDKVELKVDEDSFIEAVKKQAEAEGISYEQYLELTEMTEDELKENIKEEMNFSGKIDTKKSVIIIDDEETEYKKDGKKIIINPGEDEEVVFEKK